MPPAYSGPVHDIKILILPYGWTLYSSSITLHPSPV